MGRSSSRRATHLRLVASTQSLELRDLPLVVTSEVARKEFERLTERLVDISIEMIDLVDGDPDIEANGDEFQPEDDSEPDN